MYNSNISKFQKFKLDNNAHLKILSNFSFDELYL